MSYERGLKLVNLEPADRVGHTEYCDHGPLMTQISGHNADSPDITEAVAARRKFCRWAGYDLIWYNNDGPAWGSIGRATSMGHAVYAEGGTDFSNNIQCPFKRPEEVLAFDAAEEYGLPDIGERSEYFAAEQQSFQADFPDMLVPGGYYKTLVSGCIEAFGWDMFLMGVGADPERFGEYVLEGFYNLTLANIKAWAQTGIKAFICHDDMVWTNGAIFRPEWYRKYIFPRYKKLWEPLKEKGIKVLYCSDGTYTEFIDDIAQAGVDGFIFEPTTSLELIAERYGQSHVIIGNADCRILTFGGREEIEAEVKRCMDIGRRCPGYFMAVGNHIPPNIPMDNALYYFELVGKLGRR